MEVCEGRFFGWNETISDIGGFGRNERTATHERFFLLRPGLSDGSLLEQQATDTFPPHGLGDESKSRNDVEPNAPCGHPQTQPSRHNDSSPQFEFLGDPLLSANRIVPSQLNITQPSHRKWKKSVGLTI